MAEYMKTLDTPFPDALDAMMDRNEVYAPPSKFTRHHSGLQLGKRSVNRHHNGLQLGKCSISRYPDGLQGGKSLLIGAMLDCNEANVLLIDTMIALRTL